MNILLELTRNDKIGSDKYLFPQTVEIFDIMPSNTLNLVPFKLHVTM